MIYLILAGCYLATAVVVYVYTGIVKRRVTAEQAQLKSPFMMYQKDMDRICGYGTGKRRLKQLLKFFMDNIDYLQEPVADMGEDNPAKRFLQENLGIRIDSIEGDFDIDHVSQGRCRKYGTVLSLEVIEHLFNPLLHLEEIKEMLKQEGFAFLSTPSRPYFCWGQYHFHEIQKAQLLKLFDRAGFEIVARGRTIMRRPWYYYLFGIRPLLRLFWGNSNIYILKVKA